ncbi:MAG: hypothetical protein P4L51_03650 [Puia sp.]|nr:hypothetical protein [Puia sp.]
MSHLPGWALLPDKETSATVYSNINTAIDPSKKPTTEGNNSGRTFIAVPESNAKLVIAPAPNTRHSFQHALERFGIADNGHGGLLQFDVCFGNLLIACGMEKELSGNWQQFLTALNDIAFEKIRPTDRLFKDSEIVLGTLVKNRVHLLDFLDQAFSPLHNGFKVADFNGSLKKEEYPDNEIWMAAPCILIEEELFKSMTSV